MAAAPDDGMPADPVHARSKRRAYLAIVVMGFGCAPQVADGQAFECAAAAGGRVHSRVEQACSRAPRRRCPNLPCQAGHRLHDVPDEHPAAVLHAGRPPEPLRLHIRLVPPGGAAAAARASQSACPPPCARPLSRRITGPSLLAPSPATSYDLSAMLFAPLFGLWTDRTGTFKAQVQFGAALNAAGNLVYAFTVLTGDWWLMVVARLVAGVGAATLGIGSSYITQTTTAARRQVKLGRYRITQARPLSRPGRWHERARVQGSAAGGRLAIAARRCGPARSAATLRVASSKCPRRTLRA